MQRPLKLRLGPIQMFRGYTIPKRQPEADTDRVEVGVTRTPSPPPVHVESRSRSRSWVTPRTQARNHHEAKTGLGTTQEQRAAHATGPQPLYRRRSRSPSRWDRSRPRSCVAPRAQARDRSERTPRLEPAYDRVAVPDRSYSRPQSNHRRHGRSYSRQSQDRPRSCVTPRAHARDHSRRSSAVGSTRDREPFRYYTKTGPSLLVVERGGENYTNSTWTKDNWQRQAERDERARAMEQDAWSKLKEVEALQARARELRNGHED